MDDHNELLEYMKTLRPVSTHSHYLTDRIFGSDYCLETVLKRSYSQDLWCGVKLDDTPESRKNYFDLLKHRNCFKWLEKALQHIYHLDVPLRDDTYELFDHAIRSTYKDRKEKHLELLNQYAGYDRIILDAYWKPGDDNGHPDIFAKTFRIDSFFAGIDPKMRDHDGNNCRNLYDEPFDDFDSFFDSMRRVIEGQVQKGAVALKCAIPYERGLDVELVKECKARAGFQKLPKDQRGADIKAFQDYVFLQACEIAAQLDIPLQIHTGLGRLYRSNAIHLQPAIEANPDTKFVLFHGSYPWMDDILGLAEKYPNNVFPDLVWLPLISGEASIRFLSELIEVTNAHSICWGDDAWTPEESYGALLAARHVLASVLSEKIRTGYLSKGDAFEIISDILCNNAVRIYKL